MAASAQPAPLTARLEIVNTKGLHARASAKFSALAQEFDAHVEVSRDSLSVSACSLMGLLLLAAAKGSHIDVSVTGPQAQEALDALAALVANKFGETD